MVVPYLDQRVELDDGWWLVRAERRVENVASDFLLVQEGDSLGLAVDIWRKGDDWALK